MSHRGVRQARGKGLAPIRAALFVLGLAGSARAEPRIDPPKPIDLRLPSAPPGVDVAPAFVVDVVVSKTGEVTSAHAISGDLTLAGEIEKTALAWRFEPARRDGAPVAAKIRLRVELRLAQPAAPKAAGGETPPLAKDAAPAGSVEPVEEVTVRGARPLAPHVELVAAEIRDMPGAFGDAFRAIEALPGVIPILSGIPYFVIRGAPPGNTGYFLDGIRVPSLFHFGVGEAVIHPALVESVDLYPSVYPARFGRFAGGLLSGETVPPSDKFHGEANVRLLDSGALLETPFAGGRGDALVSGRVGYPGLLLSAFDSNVSLQYYDYQARASYRFHDGSEVGIFGFGSYDSLSARNNDGTGGLQPILGIEFERVAAHYARHLEDGGEVRVEATAGHDRTASGSAPAVTLSSESYSLLAELKLHPNDETTVSAGADVVFEPYHFDLSATGESAVTVFGAVLPTAQNDLDASLYAEVDEKLSRRVTVDLGVRGDLFTASYPGQSPDNPATRARQVPALDPRVTARFKITRALSWISAFGIAHQPSNIPLPIPALSFSQLGRGLQTAYQASEGAEAKLPWAFTATATAFANDFTGLAQLTNDCPADAPASCAATTVDGRSYGVELFVRRDVTERLSGWLSYTLSRSERAAFDGATGAWSHRLSEFDRPHVANLVVSYDLGAHWRAGGRFVAYSGSPYSTVSLDSPPNARTSPFFRLDLRLEKRWMTSWGHVSFIAEWLNVLLQKEQLGLACTQVGTTCSPELIGPITIPSLGVEVAF